MTCPKCGNPKAECIIGNFWKCPECDGVRPKAHKSEWGLDQIAFVVKGMWPQRKLDDAVSYRKLPRIVGQFFTAPTANTQHAWWRCELEGIQIAKKKHNKLDYIDARIKLFLDDVLTDLEQKTAGLGAIETLYDFPHWVTDNGQILVRVCAESDAFELRMRAIWRPV